jgi:pSer/pThr/pTyr-binding forkhead associated (FHA) protein
MKRRLLALDTTDDISVDEGLTVIGRHPTCDFKIKSARISRVHCCLFVQSGRLYVRDLNSTNGIKINGRSVAGGEIRLGDVLSVAQIHFKFVESSKHASADAEIAKREPDERIDAADSAISAEMPISLQVPLDPHESSLDI